MSLFYGLAHSNHELNPIENALEELNLNGYKTRRGCSFSPEIVKRLINN